jgi:hypothetical protein
MRFGFRLNHGVIENLCNTTRSNITILYIFYFFKKRINIRNTLFQHLNMHLQLFNMRSQHFLIKLELVCQKY